jgi:hypothetical protein
MVDYNEQSNPERKENMDKVILLFEMLKEIE